jgi:uncharacterized membrane protein
MFEINSKVSKLDIVLSKRYFQLLPLLGILSLALFLYLYKIGDESLWTDEFYSIEAAEEVPGKINKTRPVYFILLRIWMLFGSSDIWLRLLSVPFALGSIFLTYLIGKRLLGQPAGLVSALLLTLSPVFINHAQEIRMYTVSTFWGLLGTLLVLEIFKKPNITNLIGWFVCRILAILTTPLNILLLAPDIVLLMYHYRHRRRFIAVLIGIFVALVILSFPWMVTFYNSAIGFFGGWAASIEKPGITSILSRLTNFTAYWPLRSLESTIGIKFYKVYTLLVVLSIFSSLFLKQKRKEVYYLAVFLMLPAAILFLVSWIFTSVWLPRYLLMIAPYLLLLISAGFIAIKEWQPKLAIAIAVVYFLAVGGGLHAYYTKQFRPDWRGAVEFISKQDETDDILAIASSTPRSSSFISHYYDGGSPIYTVDVSDANAKIPGFESRMWLVYKPSNADDGTVDKFRQEIFDGYQVEVSEKFLNESGRDEIIEVFLLRNKRD